MKQHKKIKVSLFAKFALVIVAVGIIPIVLLVTVMQNRMLKEYRQSLQSSYAEGLSYAAYSLAARLDDYNELSKFSYYYSYSSNGRFDYDYDNYDNLRRILTGEAFASEDNTEYLTTQEMQRFLRYLCKINNNIEVAHFIYEATDGTQKVYHAGNYRNTVNNEALFSKRTELESIDKNSHSLIIGPTHEFDYVVQTGVHTDKVITVGRNYYDLTKIVGKESYVGTLLLDLNTADFEDVLSHLRVADTGVIYVTDAQGSCMYSNDSSLTGVNFAAQGIDYQTAQSGQTLFSEAVKGYGLTVWLKLDTTLMEKQITAIQRVMYIFVALSLIALFGGSVVFSRGLTRPIRKIMDEMAQVEEGRFDGELTPTSNDELGELTNRFNRMVVKLDKYTKQVYVSRIKQTEAELNALKSQIYPHFLYNTLEVIRMTALHDNAEKVAGMIEALSDQIRYLIGTVSNVVPLRLEIDMISKYIYLINCRFDNKVNFVFDCAQLMDTEIPKLILQPIVENAFVHGIKPMQGQGRIMIQAQVQDSRLVITVLDNGVGMTQAAQKELEELLNGEQPGKRGSYEWQSIGLKNVHDRLHHLYGEGCGIALFSTPSVGTAVKVTLPASLINKKPALKEDNDD